MTECHAVLCITDVYTYFSHFMFVIPPILTIVVKALGNTHDIRKALPHSQINLENFNNQAGST